MSRSPTRGGLSRKDKPPLVGDRLLPSVPTSLKPGYGNFTVLGRFIQSLFNLHICLTVLFCFLAMSMCVGIPAPLGLNEELASPDARVPSYLGGSSPGATPTRVRTYFPETWLWQLERLGYVLLFLSQLPAISHQKSYHLNYSFTHQHRLPFLHCVCFYFISVINRLIIIMIWRLYSYSRSLISSADLWSSNCLMYMFFISLLSKRFYIYFYL